MDFTPYITAAIRWGLALAAGWLVKNGLLSTDQSAELVNIIAGMALAAVPLIWSFIQKARTAKHIDEAKALAPSAAHTPSVPA